MVEKKRVSKAAANRSSRQEVRVSPRLQALMSGEITIDDLDDEEIRRGQLRNVSGDFRGRPTNWVPREFAMALAQRRIAMVESEIAAMLPEALEAHKALLKARMLMPGDAAKMTAVKEVYDRVLGKSVQRSEVHAVVETKTFDDFVGETLVDVEMEELD